MGKSASYGKLVRWCKAGFFRVFFSKLLPFWGDQSIPIKAAQCLRCCWSTPLTRVWRTMTEVPGHQRTNFCDYDFQWLPPPVTFAIPLSLQDISGKLEMRYTDTCARDGLKLKNCCTCTVTLSQQKRPWSSSMRVPLCLDTSLLQWMIRMSAFCSTLNALNTCWNCFITVGPHLLLLLSLPEPAFTC